MEHFISSPTPSIFQEIYLRNQNTKLEAKSAKCVFAWDKCKYEFNLVSAILPLCTRNEGRLFSEDTCNASFNKVMKR